MTPTPSTNPYQPPESISPPRPRRTSFPAHRTLVILRSHRAMMWALLLKLGIELGGSNSSAFTVVWNPAVEVALLLLMLGASLTLGYFVFRSAKAAYGLGLAILFALVALLPCIGSLVALVLSSDLRDLLRQSGVSVGFLGVTRDQLREWEAKAQTESSTHTSEI